MTQGENQMTSDMRKEVKCKGKKYESAKQRKRKANPAINCNGSNISIWA
jgi:hypothetical protein